MEDAKAKQVDMYKTADRSMVFMNHTCMHLLEQIDQLDDTLAGICMLKGDNCVLYVQPTFDNTTNARCPISVNSMEAEVARDDDGRFVTGVAEHKAVGAAAATNEKDSGGHGTVTEVTTTTEGIEVIQSDVRQLLNEMQATFKSASQSVLKKSKC